jgi:mRNA interferase RelE/StbE
LSYAVQIREQVRKFQATLGLEHRRALKRAILQLAGERGDIKALSEDLSGYYRLKVGRFRVIFRYLPGRVIDCVYVHERKLVYEIFSAEMSRIIGTE